MENKEFQFKGMTMNGFAMLFVNIMLTVLSVAIIVTGFMQNLNDILTGLIVGFGFAVFAVTLFIWAGFVMLEPGGTCDDVLRKIQRHVHQGGLLMGAPFHQHQEAVASCPQP